MKRMLVLAAAIAMAGLVANADAGHRRNCSNQRYYARSYSSAPVYGNCHAQQVHHAGFSTCGPVGGGCAPCAPAQLNCAPCEGRAIASCAPCQSGCIQQAGFSTCGPGGAFRGAPGCPACAAGEVAPAQPRYEETPEPPGKPARPQPKEDAPAKPQPEKT